MLAGWAAAPARFREDANAEEDAALGTYRDRLIVELLQNAADAAADTGTRGKVLIRLTDDLLEVANTGSRLTAAGVSAAATLRASAKRAASSVGHFGVGFAATLSVTTEPELISRSGGVRWSRAETQAKIAAIPALATELNRRGGDVPVLRLPFPLEPKANALVPGGYDTVVRLPLAAAGLAVASRLIAELDPTLLLVLPALAEIRVDTSGVHNDVFKAGYKTGDKGDRTFTCLWGGADAVLNGTRWTGVRRRGKIPDELLATRGVEEQSRDTYEIRALLPEGDWPGDLPMVLRAPQPTDEPLSLPAFIVASIPVDPGRRRIAAGPLADAMLAEVAATLVELAVRTGDLRLVPTGLPAGPADAAITDALRDLLPHARMLPDGRRGDEAVTLELGPAGDRVTELLTDDLPALLPASYTSARWAAARRVLGVTEMGAGELVTLLAGLARPAQWWADLYPALAAIPDRDALAALPVPLADGRLVTGPRGVLLPGPELDAAAVTGLDLRLADPLVATGPAGELLRGLGAVNADPATLLADEAVTAKDVPYQTALALITALGPSPQGVPADLGERLLLPGADGDLWPAGELLLPGGALAQVISPDAPFGKLAADVTQAYSPQVLQAAGVLGTFGILRAEHVLADPDDPVLLELDGSDQWIAERAAGDSPVIEHFHAVRDLELVRWPAALHVLAGGALRAEVLASPYTCWWLGAHPVMAGDLLPGETALPGELDGLYEPAPPDIDAGFLAAIGVRTTVAALSDPADLYDLLDRLGDPRRELGWPAARRIYLQVAEALDDPDEDPPDRIRTPTGVIDRTHVVVIDRPDLLPLLGHWAGVRVPSERASAVARMLGLPLASSVASFELVRRSPLTVRDADGVEQRVTWFGDLHDGSPEGQARSLAWVGGRWGERHTLASELRDPQSRELLRAETELDG